MNSFYTKEELGKIGFKKIGDEVLISRNACIYGASNMTIGSHVRIDDFCILSGNITIGNYVHISAYTALYGKGGIEIGNYCGCSPRSTIFSQTDDFSGEFMIGPMIPEEFTNIETGKVILEDYSQLGANTVVLPGVTLKEGAVTGSMSLVNSSLDEWTINIGIPCKKLKSRSMKAKLLSKKIR